MRKKPKKRKLAAAIITIRRASEMTPAGRKTIAAWLRMHADYLTEHGREYQRTFTGRYGG